MFSTSKDKTISQLFGNSGVKGKYGIEIEVEFKISHGLSDTLSDMGEGESEELNSTWFFENDFSLKSNGVEFITQTALDYDDVPKALEDLKDSFSSLQASTFEDLFYDSVRSGVHVHVNMTKETLTDLFKFLCVYYPLENLFTNFCGDSRKGNLFCLSAHDTPYIINLLTDCVERENLNHLLNHSIKYSSLNLLPLFSYGTIEFRSLRTSKDLSNIVPWIDMIQTLLDNSKKLESFSSIPQDISGNGLESWAEKYLGKELLGNLKYPGWEKSSFKVMRDCQEMYYLLQENIG